MINGNAGELVVLESPQAVAQAVADAFVSDAQSSIAERRSFFVALAGGTTPKAAYHLLAQEPRASAIDWNRVQVFFGDERSVPPDDNESNFKMANDAFLRAVKIPEPNIHRMRGEDDPAGAAAGYASEIVNVLGKNPRFDLILLGMGADGHTASLFPGADPRAGEEQLVRPAYVEKLHAHRITITPLVINSARHVVISTEGLPKAPALYAVLKGPYDPLVHPIQIVSPAQGRLTWYVDRAAAAELAPN